MGAADGNAMSHRPLLFAVSPALICSSLLILTLILSLSPPHPLCLGSPSPSPSPCLVLCQASHPSHEKRVARVQSIPLNALFLQESQVMDQKELHDAILRLTTGGHTQTVADQEQMKQVKKACKAGGPLVVTDVFRSARIFLSCTVRTHAVPSDTPHVHLLLRVVSLPSCLSMRHLLLNESLERYLCAACMFSSSACVY